MIEMGMGVDMHGQDITKAAARAIQDAIYHNSLPGLRAAIKKYGASEMSVNVRLGVPCNQDKLDFSLLEAIFPYGNVTFEVCQGGMVSSNVLMLAEKGDKTDDMLIVNAVIEVGY